MSMFLPGPATSSSSPRDQWHTFWNASDAPCRILEIISPAGFEHFFAEIAALVTASPSGEAPAAAEAAALDLRYGIEFDYDSIPRLCGRTG